MVSQHKLTSTTMHGIGAAPCGLLISGGIELTWQKRHFILRQAGHAAKRCCGHRVLTTPPPM